MQENTRHTDFLNNLTAINNDHVKGYEKAAEDAGDVDVNLKKLYSDLADKTRILKHNSFNIFLHR